MYRSISEFISFKQFTDPSFSAWSEIALNPVIERGEVITAPWQVADQPAHEISTAVIILMTIITARSTRGGGTLHSRHCQDEKTTLSIFLRVLLLATLRTLLIASTNG